MPKPKAERVSRLWSELLIRATEYENALHEGIEARRLGKRPAYYNSKILRKADALAATVVALRYEGELDG